MQRSDNDESSPPTSEDFTHLDLKLHDARHAQFYPSQHLLIVRDGGTLNRLELSYSCSRILELLVERAEQIVGRDEIFAFAWPGRVVGQNSLNQAISNIREVLGDDEQRTIIQTVPRRGYRFNSAFLSETEVPFVTTEKILIPEIASGIAGVSAAPVSSGASNVVYSLKALSVYTNYVLATLVVALTISLVWRVDWGLWLQQGMYRDTESMGDLNVEYISESPEELSKLRQDLQPLRDRLAAYVKKPETVLFNKMHGFYEIVCIDQGKTVQFLTVHKSKVSQLTDEQLQRCVN